MRGILSSVPEVVVDVSVITSVGLIEIVEVKTITDDTPVPTPVSREAGRPLMLGKVYGAESSVV